MIRVNRHQMSLRRQWDSDFSPNISASRIIRTAMGVDTERPVAQRDLCEIERASTQALVGLVTSPDLRSFAQNWLPALEWCCRQVSQHYSRVPTPGKVFCLLGN